MQGGAYLVHAQGGVDVARVCQFTQDDGEDRAVLDCL
jgi:hypothetical protein